MSKLTKPIILFLFFVYLAAQVGKAQSFDFGGSSDKSVLFELGAGYGWGGIDGTDSNVFKSETSGTFFGGRIGAIAQNFMFGFDMVRGSSKYKAEELHRTSSRTQFNITTPVPLGLQDATITVTATDFTSIEIVNMGLFVGYNTPIGMRIFLTYLLKAEGVLTSTNSILTDFDNGLIPDQSTTRKLKTKIKGDGLKLGVGYMPISNVSLNFEYQMIKWKELINELEGESATKQSLSSTETKAYALSLTFPFMF
jgi:hypothetical protein